MRSRRSSSDVSGLSALGALIALIGMLMAAPFLPEWTGTANTGWWLITYPAGMILSPFIAIFRMFSLDFIPIGFFVVGFGLVAIGSQK